MKSPILSLLVLLVLLAPASAETTRRHHAYRHSHVVGTHARPGELGFPITAAKDSIRIDAVGGVISQPVAVIQKERDFDTRAKRELTTPAQAPQPNPQAGPSQQP